LALLPIDLAGPEMSSATLDLWGSAPIALYSSGISNEGATLYGRLNEAMRRAVKVKALERRLIKDSWQEFVASILTAVKVIPDYEGYVYRGVPEDREETAPLLEPIGPGQHSHPILLQGLGLGR